MELRVLEYFVEIAREGNMSRVAEKMHISQPTLSKQMKLLEEELDTKLFTRVASGLILTDEGMLLRKRAEDILSLVDKTAAEFKEMDNITGGEVFIGCAESYLISHLADAIREFRKDYPLFQYYLLSGNSEQVLERLDRGLIDFAVIVEPPDLSKYNYLEMPGADTLGLLMLPDHPLAKKDTITFEDLQGIELIASEQTVKNDLPRWCGEDTDKINITGTCNLFFNGSVFVKEGLGALITFDHLAETGENSSLVFRSFFPSLKVKMFIVWKKYQIFTPIGDRLLNHLKRQFANETGTEA